MDFDPVSRVLCLADYPLLRPPSPVPRRPFPASYASAPFPRDRLQRPPPPRARGGGGGGGGRFMPRPMRTDATFPVSSPPHPPPQGYFSRTLAFTRGARLSPPCFRSPMHANFLVYAAAPKHQMIPGLKNSCWRWPEVQTSSNFQLIQRKLYYHLRSRPIKYTFAMAA
jgi:hypothetical protein